MGQFIFFLGGTLRQYNKKKFKFFNTLSLSPKWRCGSMCRQGDSSETVDGRILSSPFFVLPAKKEK